MNLEKIINITGGTLLNKYKNIKINDFKIDTRNLKKHDCYIAIKGKKYDGNDFINDKLKCSCVITTKDIKLKKIPVIKVNDTYDTLFKLGKYYRSNYKNKVICITGSNGKTTLKELISSILKTKYKVLKNEGNKNNIIGVFGTLKKLNNNYNYAIFELGMNHKKEIEKLSLMTMPTTALITNIGSSHIGNLGSRKNIFKAKMEITTSLTGDLIVNGDSKYLNKVKAYKCGTKYNNDLIAYNIYLTKDKLLFNIYLDKEYEVEFNQPTKDYISIILEAIKIGIDNNIKIDDILNTIKNYKAYDKRLNKIYKDNYIIIDDTYNASYESVKCGISTLNKINNDKIIILADMLELGKYSKKYHKKINNILKKISNKQVLTVGNYTKYIKSIHFNNNQELIKYINKLDLNNKYIYLKGSNSMRLYEVVDYLKRN